jgi:hypothetical protein
MKSLIMFFSMLVCVFLVYGCNVGPNSRQGIQPPAPDGHEEKGSSPTDTVEIIGTLIYVNLEGGFFAIQGDDGNKYNPINLPDAFKKDGMKVKALVRPQPDAMSLHMFGLIIEIIDISAR